MATINAVVTNENSRITSVLWETVTGSDTGSAFELNGEWGAASLQATGTFGDTLTIQFSNDGTTWATGADTAGNAATTTAATLIQLPVGARYIRPSAGALIRSKSSSPGACGALVRCEPRAV